MSVGVGFDEDQKLGFLLDFDFNQHRAAAVTGGRSTVNNNTYNLVQNNTSPKALTALETYQARRQQVAMLKAMM